VQMPPGDEVGEHLLRWPGDLLIGQRLHRPNPFTQKGRSHQIPHAQGGGQHFRKGPDISHVPCVIKACQSRERGGIEAKLTVIIIFYNEAIIDLSPCQQCQASGNGEPCPKRILMRWGGIDQQRGRATLRQPLDLHAILVNRNRQDVPSPCQHNPSGSRIPRFLKPNGIIGGEDGACDEVKCLRSSCCNDDVLWPTSEAARSSKVGSKCCPKCRV